MSSELDSLSWVKMASEVRARLLLKEGKAAVFRRVPFTIILKRIVEEVQVEKWGRKYAYCSKTGLPLQIEHIIPESRGGNDRVSNLTLACEDCNQRKGKQTAAEFGFPEIEQQAKQPLKDATALNATRWVLCERLKGLGLPVETGSGGLTKYNRTMRELPKAHWIDAACVGKSTPAQVIVDGVIPFEIKATGHNTRQMCRVDKYGFPRTSAKGPRTVKGFRTGDLVRATVTSGKKIGCYEGRVGCVAAAHSM
jgi:5-methylcytosine-specific restriction endonuclease McrA